MRLEREQLEMPGDSLLTPSSTTADEAGPAPTTVEENKQAAPKQRHPTKLENPYNKHTLAKLYDGQEQWQKHILEQILVVTKPLDNLQLDAIAVRVDKSLRRAKNSHLQRIMQQD